MDIITFFASLLALAGDAARIAPDRAGTVALSGRRWTSPERPTRSRRPISRPAILGLLAGLDATVLTLSGCLSILFYGDLAYLADTWPRYLALSLAGAGSSLLLGHRVELYDAAVLRTPFLRPWYAIGCWVAALVCVLATLFFLHGDERISRAWVGIWFLTGAIGLGLVRLGMHATIARWRSSLRMRQNVVIVGNAGQTAAMVARLAKPTLREYYAVAGTFHLDAPEAEQAQALAGFVRDKGAETVLVCAGRNENALLGRIGLVLAELPVDVMLCLDNVGFPLPVLNVQRLETLSLLQVSRRPMGDWGKIVKILQDRILGGMLLLLLAPVMLLAALAIRLEGPGPVLFRQQRYGFNNKPISVLKFRTMYIDKGDITGAARTVRGDPRISRVGSFLRKSSCDELPQLINVLRGDMSLVGPRAHPIIMKVNDNLYEDVVIGYPARHRVKPGITGLAQINGCRGEVDTVEKAEARLRHDLDYVARVSVWLDLKIILLTPIKAMRNAY